MPAETAYHDELGDYFAKSADASPYNAYTDRPAMLALAGAVAGLKVLDVGCGAGHYAAELLAGGAEVVGIDGSATLLRHARERLGDRAELRLHDAKEPLDFINEASFDGAVCALTLHHIADRPRLLGELRRALRPGGWLLVSTTHPTADWRRFGGTYYADDWVDLPLAGGPLAIHYQRMPLETFLNELLAAGFLSSSLGRRPACEKSTKPRTTSCTRRRASLLSASCGPEINAVPAIGSSPLWRPCSRPRRFLPLGAKSSVAWAPATAGVGHLDAEPAGRCVDGQVEVGVGRDGWDAFVRFAGRR